MEIRMLETKSGSPDGLTVQNYSAGRVYDVPEALATVFIAMGVARLEGNTLSEPMQEQKAEAATPENKAEEGAPENKAGKGKRTRW